MKMNMYLNNQAFLAAQFIAAWIAADLAVAFAHWAMDRYGDPHSRLMAWLARVFENNRLHHAWPKAILRHGPLMNAIETMFIAGAVLLGAYLSGYLNIFSTVFAVGVGMSSVIHRWLHEPIDQRCCVGRVLSVLRLIPSPRQHRDHHRYHDVNYGVLTVTVNRVLEYTKIFRRLERLFSLIASCKPFDLKAISDRVRAQRKKA